MTPDEKKRLFYIRAILRNRLEEHNSAFWDEDKALRYLCKAVELGASVKDLEEHAKKAINWSSFFNPLREELGDELYGPISFKKSSD